MLAGCRLVQERISPYSPTMQKKMAVGQVMSLEELEGLLKEKEALGEKLMGYGKTVFKGTKIERFDVEIIDIQKGLSWLGGQSLIMIKCFHPVLQKVGNVIAGMSGSPIYVKGKLIGAIAYGGALRKEPICQVTPIQYMFREMDRPVEELGFMNRSQGLGPLAVPLAIHGLPGMPGPKLEELLQKTPFIPVVSGGGSARYSVEGVKLEPGSAISAFLVRGDVQLAAVGTVTYVDGDKILAFGHPFYAANQIDIPIGNAVVHTVIPSMWFPYKASSGGKVLGALIKDRTNAIYCKLGLKSRMIPVKLTVGNPVVKSSKTINFEMVDHPHISPLLLYLVSAYAAITYEPTWHPNTLIARLGFNLKDGRKALLEKVEAGETAFIRKFFGWTWQLLGSLMRNEFEKPVIDSIQIDLQYVHENRIARIKDVWAQEDEVPPGGVVRLNVLLSRYRKPDVLEKIEIRLPTGLKRGSRMEVLVGGGSFILPEIPPPRNLDNLIQGLKRIYRSTTLVAVAKLPQYNIGYKGQILDGLPDSFAAQILSSIKGDSIITTTTLRVTKQTGYILQGSKQITLKIK
jgi:hypothetical protein